eukprot:CAMPEP_0114282818 /NCGR_PEP_ID=MMETSP0059-20121206/3764_1 /TAXON_ID=36894 /ORGANISM="Pyramimonas parkeae, Strain CCMP726" /LENGTH=233 /DNA_ID=CAMNT_0001403491 /DNA_START=18 /DNA_END=719 /DNA_ORIENTATION=+
MIGSHAILQISYHGRYASMEQVRAHARENIRQEESQGARMPHVAQLKYQSWRWDRYPRPGFHRRSMKQKKTLNHIFASQNSEGVSAQKEQVARKFYEELWSSGNLELAEEVLAEHHKQHDRGWWGGRETIGRDKLCQGIVGFRRGYPDLKFTVEEVQASEEPLPSKAFVYWRADGTNLGSMFGKEPSGQPLNISGITLLTFGVDGRIESSIVYRQASKEELYGAMNANLQDLK